MQNISGSKQVHCDSTLFIWRKENPAPTELQVILWIKSRPTSAEQNERNALWFSFPGKDIG